MAESSKAIEQALEILRAERDRLAQGIAGLEKLLRQGPTHAQDTESKKARSYTPAQKKAVSERMKKYWAQRKKAQTAQSTPPRKKTTKRS